MGDVATLENEDDLKPDDQQVTVEIEDEVVISLEGQEEEESTAQPPKRNPVRDMRKRIKEQNRENGDLNKENKLLKEQLAARNEPDDTVTSGEAPTLADCGYDTDKFQTEYSIWNAAQLDKRLDERHEERESRVRKDTATQQNETLIESHYQRASNLAVGDYEKIEDVAVAALGVQLVQSIQTTVDNSEAVIYWLGKNPEEAAKLAVQFEANPGKGTLILGALSSKVSFRPKSGKGAPDPETVVRGGGGSGNATLASKFLKRLAEASNTDNPLAARKKVREAATEAGITLPYNSI